MSALLLRVVRMEGDRININKNALQTVKYLLFSRGKAGRSRSSSVPPVWLSQGVESFLRVVLHPHITASRFSSTPVRPGTDRTHPDVLASPKLQ